MFKNARKIIMGATLALVMGVSVVGVNAETPSDQKDPFNQETEININVEKGVIEEPGDGGDGGDGGSSKGDLSIWLKPSKMNFSGKYKETGSTLELIVDDKEGSVNQLGYRRIAVADIRADEIGWTLKGKLSPLTNKDSTETIDDKYKMSMKLDEHGKYKMDGDKLAESRELDLTDKNGVEVKENIILEPKHSNVIALTEKSTETTRPGKLYTGIKLKDIKMHFEAGVGSEGTSTGQVEWTLSRTSENDQ